MEKKRLFFKKFGGDGEIRNTYLKTRQTALVQLLVHERQKNMLGSDIKYSVFVTYSVCVGERAVAMRSRYLIPNSQCIVKFKKSQCRAAGLTI